MSYLLWLVGEGSLSWSLAQEAEWFEAAGLSRSGLEQLSGSLLSAALAMMTGGQRASLSRPLGPSGVLSLTAARPTSPYLWPRPRPPQSVRHDLPPQ